MVSRLARPISGSPYFDATTSPCSVMRMPVCDAPTGRARMASKLEPPPRPTAPPRPWKKRMRMPRCRAQRHQPGDTGADFPVGGDITAILVAVGIADHHFLQIVLRCRSWRASRAGRNNRPSPRRCGEDRLWSRTAARCASAALGAAPGSEQAGFLHQQRGFQQVRRRWRLWRSHSWPPRPRRNGLSGRRRGRRWRARAPSPRNIAHRASAAAGHGTIPPAAICCAPLPPAPDNRPRPPPP